MTWQRMRNRNGLAWRPEAGEHPYPSEPVLLPEPGSRYPERALCWICDAPVPPDLASRGVCGDYHRGVFDADTGSVSGRVHPIPKKVGWAGLIGDLNRMERGYLEPEVDDGRNVGAPIENSPLHQAAETTGVDVETVRRVLAYIIQEQR